MRNSWNLEEYTALEIQENLDTHRFVVPKFQRGVVWSDKQNEELVDTIKKGLPFGTILLYRDENENNYRIIDGLQRSSAIYKFVVNPTKFFDEADIDERVIKQIIDLIDLHGNKKQQLQIVKDLLIKWVKEKHPTMKEVEEMQYIDFGYELSSEIAAFKGKEREIGRIVQPMLSEYRTLCQNMLSVKIPAIILYGSEEALPELFERINSKGTQLSKYQIYAATWINDKYDIDNEYIDIVKANRDRYDEMLYGKTELEDYDPREFISRKELNAFEIAFGIGKYISNKWPELFGASNDPVKVDSVGFSLVNCCLCAKNNDIKNMNIRLREYIGNESINMFLKRLLECINYVNKQLGKFNKFKANSRPESQLKPLHTEYQIISIIASVFINRYVDISVDENDNIESINIQLDRSNETWREKKILFENNVSKIYIMEILSQRWSGNGDKKMDAIISNPRYYLRTVSLQEFESALRSWFETSNNEKFEHKKVTAPKEGEKVILTAIYLNEFRAIDHLDGTNYDIEHLATKQLMRKQLDRFDGELKLPIGSIGNLCLLPEAFNRSKRDKTIYQDNNYLENSNLSISEIEERYSFTEEKDLEWLLDDSLDKVELRNAYMAYIAKRFDKIIDKLKDNYQSI